MTAPVDFATSMGTKSTMVRIRRRMYKYDPLYCGTAVAVPYGITFI